MSLNIIGHRIPTLSPVSKLNESTEELVKFKEHREMQYEVRTVIELVKYSIKLFKLIHWILLHSLPEGL